MIKDKIPVLHMKVTAVLFNVLNEMLGLFGGREEASVGGECYLQVGGEKEKMLDSFLFE